jgi:hypothetical protein
MSVDSAPAESSTNAQVPMEDDDAAVRCRRVYFGRSEPDSSRDAYALLLCPLIPPPQYLSLHRASPSPSHNLSSSVTPRPAANATYRTGFRRVHFIGVSHVLQARF